MRSLVRFLVIGCLVMLPVSAQHGGGGHGGGFHGGGGHAGGFHGGGGFHGVSSGFHGGGFHGGVGFGGGFGRGFYGRGFYGRGFYGFGFYPYWYSPYYYDYGYPYYGYPYYGYGYGYGNSYGYPYSSYDYGYSSSPVVVYQSNPAPVTIYESPRTARPETREYFSQPSAQNTERPIYLIAFKTQDNIRAAEAYWVTGGTLHFITLQHEQRQAPLDSIDRALTNRLNHERHVDFRLPVD